MKIFLDTLGCPKAQVDAERILHYLLQEGNTQVTEPEAADAIIVNTCGFIEAAKQESINTILEYAEVKQSRPDMKLIVSGCLSERYGKDLQELIPEIDNLTGVRDPASIVNVLQSDYHPDTPQPYTDTVGNSDRELAFSGLYTAYLKISEGCNRRCSFCAIPGIRGPLRSRQPQDILAELDFLLSQGIKEIILIGEDLCSYGEDFQENTDLIGLLEQILERDVPWVRLLYLFPHPIIDRLTPLMQKHPRLCRYLDLPLQHSSPSILRQMSRPGDASAYLDILNRLRAQVPDLAIRSTFIIGFPGETEQDIDNLEHFLREAGMDRVGFFAYSDEEGTPAYLLPHKVKPALTAKRMERLMQCQADISREKLSARVTQSLICINDGISEELDGKVYLLCRSQYDAPEIDGCIWIDQASLGADSEYLSLFRARITGVKDANDLWGEFLSEI